MKSKLSFGLIAVLLWVFGCERRFVPYVDAGDGGNVDSSRSDQQPDGVALKDQQPDGVAPKENARISNSGKNA